MCIRDSLESFDLLVYVFFFNSVCNFLYFYTLIIFDFNYRIARDCDSSRKTFSLSYLAELSGRAVYDFKFKFR